MSTLEPITRTEQFYDAILSGDTSELPTPCTREEVYLRQIAENGSGGGSSLPEVTAEDNGKVLSVVEGEWNKADASDNVVVFEIDNNSSSPSLLNGKTFSDIRDAYMSGKIPFLHNQRSIYMYIGEYWNGNKPLFMQIWRPRYVATAGELNISLYYGEIDSDNKFKKINLNKKLLPYSLASDAGKMVAVGSDGQWEMVDPPLSLPSVTSADNDKILKVVNGEWKVVSPE